MPTDIHPHTCLMLLEELRMWLSMRAHCNSTKVIRVCHNNMPATFVITSEFWMGPIVWLWRGGELWRDWDTARWSLEVPLSWPIILKRSSVYRMGGSSQEAIRSSKRLWNWKVIVNSRGRMSAINYYPNSNYYWVWPIITVNSRQSIIKPLLINFGLNKTASVRWSQLA